MGAFSFFKIKIMSQHLLGFGKKKRLLTAADFKAVFDKPSKKIHSNHLLLFVKIGEQTAARLGLAITKKKLKNANERNRLKRLTREYFRHYQHQIAPVDVVLIVKTRYDKNADNLIKDELTSIFQKLVATYPAALTKDETSI